MEEIIEEYVGEEIKVVEDIEMPLEQPVKVYVEVDKDNNIIKVFSSDFEKPTETSIKIDEGFGDRYRHAQSQYFDKPLMNDDGSYNYSYIGGVVVEN